MPENNSTSLKRPQEADDGPPQKRLRISELIREELAGEISRFFNSPVFSDLRIKCGDRIFSVHRIVLAARSKYFQNLFRSGFKESTSDEISLDEDPAIMAALLEYCYSGEYVVGPLYSPELFHVKIYRAADYFAMEEHLQDLAVVRSHEIVSDCFDVDTFLDAVEDFYSNNVDSSSMNRMREFVAALGYENIHEICTCDRKLGDETKKL